MDNRLRKFLESPNLWFVVATVGTLFFFSSLIPMIISPVFLVLTTWKYGYRMGLAVAALSTVSVLFLFNLPVATFFFTQFVMVGILLGHGLSRKAPPLSLLFTTTLISTLLVMAAGAVYLYHGPVPFSEMIQQGGEAVKRAFEESVKRLHPDPDELARYRESMIAMLSFVKNAFPALLFINAFSIVYLSLLVPLHYAGRLGLDRSHIPPLKEISIPFVWVWGLILSGPLYLFNVPNLKWVGLNVALIFLLAYLMQGYAILSFYLNKTRLPGIFKGVLYLTCLINVSLMITLCGVGLFDTWFNFRKRFPVPRR